MSFLRKATANGKRPAWALKLDVASFFPSIEKRRLNRILRQAARDPELRWLTRVVLFHGPTRDYRFQALGPRARAGARRNRARDAESGRRHSPGRLRASPDSGCYRVPPRKSLFGKGNRRGLSIGNLTSQFWANVYLNELDQFVKRTLRCRYYLRHVDDLCLVSHDPAQLERWRDEIARFLRERLDLLLRPDPARPSPSAAASSSSAGAPGGTGACRAD
jgi:RNA-directed DNA polymerase